jgi:hypothetical protein
MYRNAADMTMSAGNAGANTARMANLGAASGYGAAQIGDGERVQIDPAARSSASRGIQFSQPYENRYTDQVVNTTLANFDEQAGRQRAAEAAQAAGNNAFGGSRFGVQRAITEEQIARERASQESGLRFGAQDRAFSLGMQDASTETQNSQFNAGKANKRAQAQAGMDFNRLLANMGAQNEAGAFGANAANSASQFNAGSRNQAGMFGADAANRSALDFAGRSDVAGQFGADAANRSALDFAGRSDAAGQFGAGRGDIAVLSEPDRT